MNNRQIHARLVNWAAEAEKLSEDLDFDPADIIVERAHAKIARKFNSDEGFYKFACANGSAASKLVEKESATISSLFRSPKYLVKLSNDKDFLVRGVAEELVKKTPDYFAALFKNKNELGCLHYSVARELIKNSNARFDKLFNDADEFIRFATIGYFSKSQALVALALIEIRHEHFSRFFVTAKQFIRLVDNNNYLAYKLLEKDPEHIAGLFDLENVKELALADFHMVHVLLQQPGLFEKIFKNAKEFKIFISPFMKQESPVFRRALVSFFETYAEKIAGLLHSLRELEELKPYATILAARAATKIILLFNGQSQHFIDYCLKDKSVAEQLAEALPDEIVSLFKAHKNFTIKSFNTMNSAAQEIIMATVPNYWTSLFKSNADLDFYKDEYFSLLKTHTRHFARLFVTPGDFINFCWRHEESALVLIRKQHDKIEKLFTDPVMLAQLISYSPRAEGLIRKFQIQKILENSRTNVNEPAPEPAPVFSMSI